MTRGTRASRPALVRQRLVERAVGPDAAPLTVLQGLAGLGKSVVLKQVADHARRARLAWVTSTQELATYVGRLDDVAGDRPPVNLVLVDGLDDAAGDDVSTLVASATRGGAARIVVATRTPLDGVTPGMVLDGDAVIVATDDLLFTHEEVAALAARLKVSIEPDEAAELHRATDGWPAMVDAALRARRPHAPLTARRLQEIVDRFVRDEVLGAVPDRERSMLAYAAAVPRFDASMLALLLADLDPGVDAVDVINRWSASGRIVHDPVDGHWRFPEPVRQCLHTDLEIRHRGRRAELTMKAAQKLVAEGHTTDALPYLVETSLDQVVAGVLRDRWISDVVAQGRFLETGPAMASMKDETLSGDPALLLISAVSALAPPADVATYAYRLSQAGSVLDRSALNGPLLTFHSLSMMLARFRGDIDQANSVERSGLQYIDAASDQERNEHAVRLAYFNHQTGCSRVAEGRLDDAAQVLRSALTTANRHNGDWYVANIESLLGYTELLRGDVAAATRNAEAANEVVRRRGWSEANFTDHLHLTFALLELEHGRTWNVSDMLNRALGALRGDAEPPASRLAIAWSVLGLLANDPSAAEQALLLCGPEYATNRLPFNRFLAVMARAHARLVHDDPKAALAELDGLNEAAEGAVPPGHGAHVAVARARAYLALDDPHAALRELAGYSDTDEPMPLTVRADLQALAVECALRLDRDPRASFGRLLALLERTGSRRPVLLLPRLRDAVVTGQLGAPPSSPLASLGVEVAALLRCNAVGAPALSDREREVLAAMAGPETLATIAKGIYVSGNTLKTVTRGLYRKLGAADRHQAVRVALALDLLPPIPR